MWSLAFASLRFRWLSFVGIFVTVMAAATLVTATGSLLEGGIRGCGPARTARRRRHRRRRRPGHQRDPRSRRGPGDRRAAPSSSGSGSPPTWLAQVASVPGVADVVADVSFPAYVVVDGEQVAGPGRDAVARALVEQCRHHAVPARRRVTRRPDPTRS